MDMAHKNKEEVLEELGPGWNHRYSERQPDHPKHFLTNEAKNVEIKIEKQFNHSGDPYWGVESPYTKHDKKYKTEKGALHLGVTLTDGE